MLTIDRKQYDALQEAMRAAFGQRLAAHVRQHFPVYASLAGARGMGALIELALAGSQRHGYAAEREIALWLNLMLQLGAAFDQDPLLPWHGNFPAPPSAEGSFLRLNGLYDTAEGYLGKVAGEGGEHLFAAVGRFLLASPQELVIDPSRSAEALVNAIARLYPEKHQATDFAALQVFMQGTISRCLHAGINAKDKIVLLIQFDYLLGWEAETNPVYAPALTRGGVDSLADVALPELLQRMKALVQQLSAAFAGGTTIVR